MNLISNDLFRITEKHEKQKKNTKLAAVQYVLLLKKTYQTLIHYAFHQQPKNERKFYHVKNF